ncbi:MAG: AarF/UbiB family protein [Acidimicrobiales bacterium]
MRWEPVTAEPKAAAGFRGPFADGPPPEALRIAPPPLEKMQMGDAGRFVHVAVVVVRCVVHAVVRALLHRGRRGVVRAACDGLVDSFIRLGPTTVKGGQIIASSGALFPPVLVEAARRCLDAVPPFDVAHVRAAIEGDLGYLVEHLFASFDPVPLSAASIGQVHACVLADGRDAVVKVQRPGIHRQMATDLRIGYRIAWLIEKSPWGRTTNAQAIVRDLHAVTFAELNPAYEAWQQHRFREKIGAFGDNEGITAPKVYWDYCGPSIICMERVYGIPMDHFDAMKERGIDGQLILRRGAKVWAESVMVHGPFHGDMHAGNMWILDDGRGCYLDFGIMGELPGEWKDLVKDLFYTCAFDLDFVRVARAYRRVGAIPKEMGSDEELGALLSGMLRPILADGFGSLDITQLVIQSLEVLKLYKASAPRELVLVAKQLLYVDKYTRYLAPNYSLTADPFIVKNIFPEAASAKAIELGLDLDTGELSPRTAPEPATAGVVGRTEEHKGVGVVCHEFLSPDWIDAVRAIREEYRVHEDNVAAPALRANLVVTDVPFGDGIVRAHVDSSGSGVEIDLGHVEGAELTITIDHATARAMVVEQQPVKVMQAFMSGKVVIDGDLAAALGDDPMALMRTLDLGAGSSPVADPVVIEIGGRIRNVTA